MIARISKSTVKGMVVIPSSKSYCIRGLICAALAKGESTLLHPLFADDTEAAYRVLEQIGVTTRKITDRWSIAGGNFQTPETDLFCGESAATLRFMTAVCSAIPGKFRLTVGTSLEKRPIGALLKALKLLGARCYSSDGQPPILIDGGTLIGGRVELPGDVSSQFVSALLLAAPLAKEKVHISLTSPLESKPYVSMTIECMEKFGVKVEFNPEFREFIILPQVYAPTDYIIEGDWSSASYFLALGAIAGEVTVGGLNYGSLQGDMAMVNILQEMGANIVIDTDSIKITKASLQAVKTDLSNCIDILPTVAVLAATAEGTSEFTGIKRARLKESDRVAVLAEGLKRMGVPTEVETNKMTITGSQLIGAEINSANDHRIAMAFSILGTLAGNTIIKDAECVKKTFPSYWELLRSVGGKVKIDE